MVSDGQVRLATIDDSQRHFAANEVHISANCCEAYPTIAFAVVFGLPVVAVYIVGKIAGTRLPRASSDLPKKLLARERGGRRSTLKAAPGFGDWVRRVLARIISSIAQRRLGAGADDAAARADHDRNFVAEIEWRRHADACQAAERANSQPQSASARPRDPVCSASLLAALPALARANTPSRMTAMRNSAKAR
jgi:hypothetical protein